METLVQMEPAFALVCRFLDFEDTESVRLVNTSVSKAVKHVSRLDRNSYHWCTNPNRDGGQKPHRVLPHTFRFVCADCKCRLCDNCRIFHGNKNSKTYCGRC